jgi:ribosome-binding protein aMBF1 (putative translation factor)
LFPGNHIIVYFGLFQVRLILWSSCVPANAMDKSIHSASYAVFLKVLRATRERAGLSQEEVARRIGEKQTFVSKCERGERRIDVVELRTFCRAFGVSLSQFVADMERAIRRPK